MEATERFADSTRNGRDIRLPRVLGSSKVHDIVADISSKCILDSDKW
jgi:hypothetical protein